jgi:hypothetical protein
MKKLQKLLDYLNHSQDYGVLVILAVYVPVASSDLESGQLEAQLRRWLQGKWTQEPGVYIFTTLLSRIRRHQTRGRQVLVGGDFNMLIGELETVTGEVPGGTFPFSHPATAGVPTRERGRRVDHMVGWGVDFLSHTLHNGAIYQLGSDHYPISCQIGVAPEKKGWLERLPRGRDIDLGNEKEVARYQDRLMAYVCNPTTGYTPSVEEICYFSAQLLQEPPRKGVRFGKRHLWSPRMIALMRWYILLNETLRAVQVGKPPGGLVQQCKNRVLSLGPDGPQEWIFLQTLGMTERELRTCDRASVNVLRNTIKATKALSHAKDRQLYRDGIKGCINARERAGAQGRLGKAIASMLPNPRIQLDLNRLELGEGRGAVEEPRAVHISLNGNFEIPWFGKRGHPSEALDGDTWDRWKADPKEFRRYANQFGVPDLVVQQVEDGLFTAALEGVEIEEHSVESVAPLREEFGESIAVSPDGKAAGPSGCTYGMMKAWPEAVKDEVFRQTDHNWRMGTMGKWWKSKKLCPIPKDANPTLASIRPIMLLECLRKVWMKIVVRRFTAGWEPECRLAEGQYGFRSGRSTGMAVLQVINALEEAEEEATMVYVSSYDIRRAFDSISRPLIVLSLRRLGLDKGLAERIGMMDEGDVVMPITPWSEHFPDKAETFSTGRGTGQGDVTSPTLWGCFFDILLRALESTPSDFLVRGSNGFIYGVGDTAYADDLLSISATPANLQAKADVVSAFALMFGLELALPKFRTMVCNWGMEHKVVAPGITIRTEGWAPAEVPFTTEVAIKYLGSLQDSDNRGRTEFQKQLGVVKKAAGTLATKAASPELHAKVAASVTYAQVVYAAQFGPWSLADYRRLDKPLLQLIRGKAHAQSSFPEALMVAPRSAGGLGIVTISAKAQEAKWRLVQRCLASGDRMSRVAAEGVLERMARAGGLSMVGGGECD